MSDKSAETNGMPLIHAVAGSIAGLGLSVWMTYAAFFGIAGGQTWNYQWWEHLFFWGLVVTAFVKGLKCLCSLFYQIQRLSPEKRYWKEQDAEEKIWEITGGFIVIGLLGFFFLMNFDNSGPSSQSITLGEGIIIGLLIAVIYNQRRK